MRSLDRHPAFVSQQRPSRRPQWRESRRRTNCQRQSALGGLQPALLEEQSVNDFAMHVGQAILATLVAKGETCVIDAAALSYFLRWARPTRTIMVDVIVAIANGRWNWRVAGRFGCHLRVCLETRRRAHASP